MTDNSFSLRAAYRQIKIIYFAILGGPILFGLIALYINPSPTATKFDLSEPLNLALIIATLATVYSGGFVARTVFKKIGPESSTEKRMKKFQAGLIIRLATYEFVEFFAIVVFMLTGNLLVLLFALVGLFGIITNYPGPAKIRQAVGITESELLA